MEGEEKMETLEKKDLGIKELSMKKDLGLKELSKKLKEFAESNSDWEENPSPTYQLDAMVGQVEEISNFFMSRGGVVKGLPNWKESEKQSLGAELSEALLYLIRLADICGIDLADATTENIVNIAIRYPSKTL